MLIKRIFIILTLILSLTIFSSGCHKETPAVSNADETFENTCDYITDSILTGSAIDLHFCLTDTAEYDKNTVEKSLGSITAEPTDTEDSFYSHSLQLINDIDPSSLSEENAYRCQLMQTYLNNQIALSAYDYKYEPLSAFSGEHIQVPLLLTEFAFNDSNDIDIYFKLLSDFPNYFEEIAEYEKEKNEAGEFMSESALSSVINFCKQFPTEDPAQHFLSKSFEEKLSHLNLDEATLSSYITKNRELLETIVFPAYTTLENELTALSDNALFHNEGLCNTSSGREYYSALVKNKTGDSRSLSDIGAELEQRLSALSQSLTASLSANPALWETILSGNFDRILDGEETLEKAAEYLDKLYQLSESHFSNNQTKNFSVEYIEPHLSPYFSSAFFLLPPVDDFDNPTIYINPDTQFASFDLFTTLAHEGFPGHLQQTIAQKDNLISRLFSCLGYCEGWATYCELYTYPAAVKELKLGDKNQAEDIASILKIYRELTLCVYALLDYNIHYNYWTCNDVEYFLTDYGIAGEETVERIYNYIVSEPANYMTYYVGYINVLSLKEQYIAAGHTEKEFHQAFLACPEAPFDVVKNKLLVN